VATPLLKTCQNFCQQKEVKAMNRELSDIIAMVEAGQFDLALQAAQEIEDATVSFSGRSGTLPKRWRRWGNLTVPSKSPRKLKSAKIESASFLGA
jgi:hypothetical protein